MPPPVHPRHKKEPRSGKRQGHEQQSQQIHGQRPIATCEPAAMQIEKQLLTSIDAFFDLHAKDAPG